jgi:hypothetical protein
MVYNPLKFDFLQDIGMPKHCLNICQHLNFMGGIISLHIVKFGQVECSNFGYSPIIALTDDSSNSCSATVHNHPDRQCTR